MARGAAKGTKYWTMGPCKERRYQPDELRKKCEEYFVWVENNPILEERVFASQGRVIKTKVPKMRAMTALGCCLFMGLDYSVWMDYRTKGEYKSVISWAEGVIRTQKFEGASADQLNASIIMRDLGLAEKSELSGPDGGPIETAKRELTIDELKEEAKKRGLPTSIFDK